jgi:hypothetical protein
MSGWAVTAANTALDGLVGAFVQLHVGEPGPAGTSNVASVTTRPALTWGASANGLKAITNQPVWAAWAGSNQTITHISQWTAATAGTFKGSAALSTPVAVTAGATITLTALTVPSGPIAA